jgi:Zn-dependent membrane protease YugP
MNPFIIIVPAAALIVGPRLWARQVLRHHNLREEDFPATARELARAVLDEHQLGVVVVEATDIGDHYDPEARAVRLSRDKIDRRTLTAVTTAAHEVSHALQHAAEYPPFMWRRKLAELARIVGEAGMVILLAAPLAGMWAGKPLPPRLLGAVIMAMLGTGMAAQFSAVPSELNASFGKAMPILRSGYIGGRQLKDARTILMACSLTYIASSMAMVLNIWPWLGRRPAAVLPGLTAQLLPLASAGIALAAARSGPGPGAAARTGHGVRRPRDSSRTQALVRQYGTPVIRGWMRLTHGLRRLAESVPPARSRVHGARYAR